MDNTRCSTTSFLTDLINQVEFIAFDFDGVFTDNKVYTFQDGREAVMCSRGDGMGLSKLRKINVDTMVISTETNPCVSMRCEKLGIRCVQGCDDKIGVLESELKKRGLSLEQAAFVGNDTNDLPCLERVGLPIVVQDAHPDVIPFAKYRTLLPGGHGAVREICDMVDRIKGAAFTEITGKNQ